MIKISALNEDSSEESDDEDVPTITKEAQEQIALTEYNKALELLKEKKNEDALAILKDLLETELLDQVEKPEVPDGRPRPMLSLKYSCFKNIGAIQAELGNYEDSIDNYWEATNLDDTDVMLWYRLGTLATKTYNLELACSSFKYGLKCNPNHWPCLDSIVTALYAVPDYMSCLLYISVALERDPSYIKGLAFREKIFRDIPNFEDCYKVYNSDWEQDPPLDTEYDHIIGDKLLAEARDLAEKWAEACRPEFCLNPLPDLKLNKPVTEFTWLSLGESLISMHKHISDNNHNFVSHIKLDVHQGEDDEDNLDEDHCDDIESPPSLGEKQQNYVRIEENFNQIFEDKSHGSSSDNKNDIHGLDNDNDAENFDSKNPTPVSDIKDNNVDTDMEVDMDDERKSNSSDIQIIEDEDPLRILDSEDMQLEDQISDKKNEPSEFQIGLDNDAEKCNEQIISSEDKSSEKEPGIDKSDDKLIQKSDATDKSSDKPSKTDDKSSEKTDGKEEGRKVKKRRRSSLCFLEQWAWSSGSMRRSARVRSSNRREAERDDVQLEEALRRIFPSSLLPDSVRLRKENPLKSMEDSMDTMDLYRLFANRENGSNTTEGSKSSESSKPGSPVSNETQELYFGTNQEKIDVAAFINEHSEKSNLMIIIAKFTEFLCTKWNHVWPKGLPEVYLQTYVFTREHVPHPSPFNDAADDNILKLDAEMTLLYGELHTDRWLNDKPEILPSSTIDKMGTGLPSEELGQIIFTSVRDDLFNEQYVLFFFRVLWLKANLFLCQGDTDVVIESLGSLLCHLKELQGKGDNMFLRLPNCKYNSYISIKIVEKMLTSVQRGRKLGEIQYLHDEKKYSELASILQDTFKFAKQQNKLVSNNDVVIDRAEQLSMLLNSLWQLEQYEDCYVWSEACLHEAWQNYLRSTDELDQKKWASSVLNSLERLDACVTEVSTFVVRYLPTSRLTRFVQNLVHIVCYQLDVPESAIEMPLETVLPWILLHHILQHEEDKERAKTDSPTKNKSRNFNNSDSDDEVEDIPASLMLLFTAHEFLGRRSWCCINEAKLLLFTMDVTIPKLKTPQLSPVKNKLMKYIEQVLFCLYAHPSKTNKTKAKYIEEHGVPQMKLTWEAAQQLYDFYKLDTLPAIDDYKVLSITSEMENLFKRITKLVPPESDPAVIADDMLAFIKKDEDEMPSVKKPLPYQISSIYYLLADYYFKTSDWSHGIRYYLLDLCLHPFRFNSWVGLAMATGTQLQIRLNSCQTLKNENSFLDKAKIAQYSYQKASELDPGHSLIWIEYGNFVYMVHSFCSRVLKQEAHKLSMEKFEVLETRKDTMLELAAHCFLSANRLLNESAGLQDDRWLTYYILGKIAEKKNEEPPVFLEHYHKASLFLYENKASYPRKISYNSPHNLSVEALEVYYRIHASILKYLEQHEGKPLKKSLGLLFQQYLKNCANSPFMKHQSKSSQKKGEDEGSDSEGRNVSKENSLRFIEFSKTVTTIEQRSNSIEEIEIVDKSKDRLEPVKPVEQIKSENNRKRVTQDTNDCTKRVKLSNVSHLQLMQDVVALIDDLITKVCDMTNSKEVSEDDIVMLTSSDDNEDTKPVKDKRNYSIRNEKDFTQNKNEEFQSRASDSTKVISAEFDNVKEENIQDFMDVLMQKTMEISQEDTQQSFPDDDDTRKSEGQWLQNEDPTGKDNKLRQEEKKKSPVGIIKEDVASSRRGSQESTTTTQTTTTTETNNSSSSSSDESSSSDDSSDSDSSSDSESESDSDSEKKKKNVEQKEEFLSDEEVGTLTAYCLAGLEQCILRFPQHYKSFYRLSHFFFNNKTKDITKCKDLLLGAYNCQFYPGKSFQGLFFERKSSNFFNGVWRIPVEEVDRGGSFASHMSKCITLLMQVLKESNDSDMLMELGLQLSKKPDFDKKYLRDSEREQLSDQAMTLCLQSLRTRVSSMGPPNGVPNNTSCKNDSRMHVLLDVYKTYQCVQKHCSNVDVKNVADLLTDTYKTYMGNKNIEGNVLELATKWCQQQIAMNKTAPTPSTPSVIPQVSTPVVVTSSPVSVSQPAAIPSLPQSSQIRKAHKTSSSSSGRPRGRPPNINKYQQALQQNANMFNQFNAKSGFGNYLGQHNNSALLNPYFMSPLMDANVLTAMLANMSGNMIDPTTLATLNYLNQVGGMGGYQEVIRQYQNNLSTMTSMATGMNPVSSSVPNISNVSTMSTASSNVNTSSNLGHLNHLGNLGNLGGLGNLGNLGNLNNLGGLTMQQYLSLGNSTASMSRSTPTYHQTTPKVTTTTTTTTTTKEKPSISITPVNNSSSSNHKPSSKTSKNSLTSDSSSTIVHSSNSNQISQSAKNAAQVSLLKPSVIQQVKSLPPKQMSAPQIRVSKTLTEPQPAHKSSLSHSPVLKGSSSTSPSSMPQAAHSGMSTSLSMKPPIQMSLPSQGSGTSLQHKLLSKKQQQQQPHPAASVVCPPKKQKTAKKISSIASSYQNLINNMANISAISQTPYLPPDLNSISLSQLPSLSGSKGSKSSGYRKTSSKSKTAATDVVGSLSNTLSQSHAVEAMSVLSQLQQHSHLEIIPQHKNQPKSNMDFSLGLPSSLSVTQQKIHTSEPVRTTTVADNMSVYELSRPKGNNTSSSSTSKKSEKLNKDGVEIITLDD